MEKIKVYSSLVFAFMACFTLGMYTYGASQCGDPVEPYRWIVIILACAWFLSYFLNQYRKPN